MSKRVFGPLTKRSAASIQGWITRRKKAEQERQRKLKTVTEGMNFFESGAFAKMFKPKE